MACGRVASGPRPTVVSKQISAGLRRAGFRIVSVSSGKVFGIESHPLPKSVVINHNLLHNAGSGYLATVVGVGGTTSLSVFRTWTGFEQQGLTGDPRFRDAANRDYRLRSDSPAVDRGRLVSGVTDGYRGAAPDIGRFEY